MGGISITQLLIIAVIVVLLFGTKNCARWAPISAPRSRGFKKAIGDDTPSTPNTAEKSSLDDADFSAKPITDKQPEVKPEESKNKEQV